MNSSIREGLRAIVGLEVHVQLSTRSKVFSRGLTSSLGPNESIVPLDVAFPGVLPIPSKQSIELALRTSLLFNCSISSHSWFDRKHYFYADMPAGYQITQHEQPIARDGQINVFILEENIKKSKMVDVIQVQIEHDSGKSIHDDNSSLIDLNRSGCGLVEIVTSPCFSNGIEASSFIRQLRLLLIHHRICDGQMHKGQLRVDANVSLMTNKWNGQRTEIKNMNSVGDVHNAIDYEIRRQKEVLNKGEDIVFETRTVDTKGRTVCMREKERIDYRFMHEPNIPPIKISNSLLDQSIKFIKSSIPLHERLINDCGFSPHSAVHLSEEDSLSLFINECIKVNEGKTLSYIRGPLFMEWLMEVKQICQRRRIVYPPTGYSFHIQFIHTILLVKDEKVTKLSALDAIKEFLDGKYYEKAETWFERRDQWRIRDEEEMKRLIVEVIDKWNEKEKVKGREGNKKILQRMRNEVIIRTEKRIDVDDVRRLIDIILKECINMME